MAKKVVKKPKTEKVAKLAKPGKYVYYFGDGKADGDRTMKDLLGGKGSGLAEMTNAKLPVPAGFTISTPVCTIYYKEGGKIPASIDKEMIDNLRKLEKSAGRKLGDTKKPLLVSVRSGAKFSMPGMMDTILNLGLNDETVESLKQETGNGRFAADSYRRFIQMFGNVVLEIPKDVFEHELDAVKKSRGAKADTDLDEAALREVIARYKKVVKKKTGKTFPQDPIEQLKGSRNAVFRSWQNPRAKEYRRIYDIPDYIGTAVNVQQMVFGNTGDRSATGVGFTRSPATGAKEFYGEFLINAQGEDVVSGVRTPQQINELEKVLPKAYKQLREITTRLEKHYKDVQDFEFTIQDEKLYMLQTRSGKRTGLCGGRDRHRSRRTRRSCRRRRPCCWSIPKRSRSCCRPDSIRANGPRFRSSRRGCPRRRAQHRVRSSSPRMMPWNGRARASRSSSSARKRFRTTSTACTWRRAF